MLHQSKVYQAGYDARLQGFGSTACPYGLAVIGLRCLWLAGWHDKDIEVG